MLDEVSLITVTQPISSSSTIVGGFVSFGFCFDFCSLTGSLVAGGKRKITVPASCIDSASPRWSV